MLKKLIKKFIPKNILSIYHLFLAYLAAFVYKNPSQKMIVVGVTGTNGKTTTVNLIGQYLEFVGQKTGFASTVNFKVGTKSWLNNKKMTMLGRFQTQKLLSQMVKAGCRYAIIETSSQGIDQFRHIGINYDLIVFTNLTPEHIEAHGSFEAYRAAKEKLFKHLNRSHHKMLHGRRLPKTIISNNDDKQTERLRQFKADKFITYSFDTPSDYRGENLKLENGLAGFAIKGHKIKTNLIGRFNGYNVLAALTVLEILGFDLQKTKDYIAQGIDGRQEWIDPPAGGGQDFKVMVDYAPEPVSLENLYQALKNISKKRLIHVLGSCGGGRDRARQPVMGQLAGETADIVIITNEDPYDDDPQEIIDNVATGAIKAGKTPDKDLFKILDRVSAIKKALELAQKDDLVLITGKGAEQYICGPNGQKIPHDDRVVVRKILGNGDNL